MFVDAIPLWLFFVGTIAIIGVSVEAGFALGKIAARRSPELKESPAAAVGAAVLGLVAFMLAFTFSIASGRFDARKQLVRDDADAIRSAWLKADFLPDADRVAFRRLLTEYLDLRLSIAESRDPAKLPQAQVETIAMQHRLWAHAVANGRRDNSDISAAFVDSVNELINVHAQRIAIGWEGRIAGGIWIALYVLAVLGMLATGYQMGIAGPVRSRTGIVLAISFALVMTLIVDLDRPFAPLIPVSQRPLMDLQTFMNASTGPASSSTSRE